MFQTPAIRTRSSFTELTNTSTPNATPAPPLKMLRIYKRLAGTYKRSNGRLLVFMAEIPSIGQGTPAAGGAGLQTFVYAG